MIGWLREFMELAVSSAEREQLFPGKERSGWGPRWRHDMPTSGAVGTWGWGAGRPGQPHTGHWRRLEPVGAARQRKPAERAGLLVARALHVYRPWNCLCWPDLQLQRGSLVLELTEARKSADRTQTQVFPRSTITDCESKDVICEKTFPFSFHFCSWKWKRTEWQLKKLLK